MSSINLSVVTYTFKKLGSIVIKCNLVTWILSPRGECDYDKTQTLTHAVESRLRAEFGAAA